MSSAITSSTFNHSAVDFVKAAPRRAHMEAFFRHLGLWNEERVKEIRKQSEEKTCVLVENAGYRQVNQVYFEFVVDQIVWYNILREGNALGQGHDWPWPNDAAPDKTDVSTDGASECYKEWRRRKVTAKMEQTIATGRILNFKLLHGYRNYIPEATRIECLFGSVSTQFPCHQVKGMRSEEAKRHVVGVVKGAFPSRTKFYTDDEILLRTNYKLLRGE